MKSVLKVFALVLVVLISLSTCSINDLLKILETPASSSSGGGGDSSLPSISIVNNTGYNIREINISLSNSDSWGKDLLGGKTLGRTDFTYRFPQAISEDSDYDIRLIDEDGDKYIKWDFVVRDKTRVVFSANDLYFDEAPATQTPVAQAPAAQTPAAQTPAAQTPTAQTPAGGSARQPAGQPVLQPVESPMEKSRTRTPVQIAGRFPIERPVVARPPQSPEQNAVGAAIVTAAQKYLGASYVYGAQNPPQQFDCSGFVKQAYNDGANLDIPRSTTEIWARGTHINRSALLPGDIIVYSENGSVPSHVAIYKNSTEMIHCVSLGSPTGVISQNQSSGSWPGKELGYITFVDNSSATPKSGSSLSLVSGLTVTPRTAAKVLVVSSVFVDITQTISRKTEELAVQTGTALSFVMTNKTGQDASFDLYFYKVGTSKARGETESLSISNGSFEESMAFLCASAGQYRFEIVRKADNKTLLEYTYKVVN